MLSVQPMDTSTRNLIATIATSSHHNLSKRNVHSSRRNGFGSLRSSLPSLTSIITSGFQPYSCAPQLRHQNSRTPLTLASPDAEPILRKPLSHTGLRASTNQERHSALWKSAVTKCAVTLSGFAFERSFKTLVVKLTVTERQATELFSLLSLPP